MKHRPAPQPKRRDERQTARTQSKITNKAHNERIAFRELTSTIAQERGAQKSVQPVMLHRDTKMVNASKIKYADNQDIESCK